MASSTFWKNHRQKHFKIMRFILLARSNHQFWNYESWISKFSLTHQFLTIIIIRNKQISKKVPDWSKKFTLRNLSNALTMYHKWRPWEPQAVSIRKPTKKNQFYYYIQIRLTHTQGTSKLDSQHKTCQKFCFHDFPDWIFIKSINTDYTHLYI